MSDNVNVSRRPEDEYVAPTPQNTPLQNQSLTRDALSRPTVGTVEEEDEETAAANAPDEKTAAALAGNKDLSAAINSRLGQLSIASAGAMDEMPDYVRRRVAALEGLQAKHLKLEAEFQHMVMDLERKFASKYEPLYKQRKDIVLGTTEPSAELVEEGQKSVAEQSKDTDQDKEKDEKEDEDLASVKPPADAKTGIPMFWLTVLHTHPKIEGLISERDEEALSTLRDIRCEQLPAGGKPGFKIIFEFDPENQFFKNTELTKTYYYLETVGPNGDLVYDHAEGTPIEWRSGDKDLTIRAETKKQRNKKTNETRVVKRMVPTQSFFNFFSPPTPPKVDDDSDDEELADLESRLELDYQLGEDLKDRVVPHAIQFFTGDALDYEDFGPLDDFDDEDDEDEDDAEEDDTPAPQGATAQSADPQECRQQ